MDIKKIGKEMAKQNNRGTQYVMFVIMQDVEIPAYWRGDAEHQGRPEEIEVSLLCDDCLDIYSKDDSEPDDLPDNCDDCQEDAFHYWNIEQQPALTAGIFFTEKACEQHIKLNHYHYTNPISYGIGSWRNFEMQAIQKHLIENAGEKVPSHYK